MTCRSPRLRASCPGHGKYASLTLSPTTSSTNAHTLQPNPRFTDGSAGLHPTSEMPRFGIGVYFGFENSANVAEPASLQCSSMHEAEIAAVARAFTAARQMSIDSNSPYPICKRVIIYIDNLESKELIETAIKENLGNLALESLLSNNSRVREHLNTIREHTTHYTSIQLCWIRSHTTTNSFTSRGNDSADQLAKIGLQQAFALTETLD